MKRPAKASLKILVVDVGGFRLWDEPHEIR